MDFQESACQTFTAYVEIRDALQRIASRQLSETGICEHPDVVSWSILPDGRFAAEWIDEDRPKESGVATFLSFMVEAEVKRTRDLQVK